MKSKINVSLPKPVSIVKFFKNNVFLQEKLNTVTRSGLAEIMLNHATPLVNASGGRLTNLIFSSDDTPFTFETDIVTGIIGHSTSFSAPTVQVSYATIAGRRYANINLFYKSPVFSVTTQLHKVAISRTSVLQTPLFGLSLDEPIDIEPGDQIDVVYSIRLPVVTSLTGLASGAALGTNYSLAGVFGVETVGNVTYRWPHNSNNVPITTGPYANFFINGSSFGNGTCRYISSLIQEDYQFTYRITAQAATTGNNSILNFEFGYWQASGSGYVFRCSFTNPVVKSDIQLFEIDLELTIVWE